MAIDQAIQNVIQKHADLAAKEVNALIKAEVEAMIRAQVAGVVGVGSGRGLAKARTAPTKTKAKTSAARPAPAAPKSEVSAPRVAKVHRAGGGRICIAPGCKKLSKGPRFHFLCESHVKAPKAQVAKWQQTAAKAKKRA